MLRYLTFALAFALAFLACNAFAAQDVVSAVVVPSRRLTGDAKTVMVKTADGAEQTIISSGAPSPMAPWLLPREARMRFSA